MHSGLREKLLSCEDQFLASRIHSPKRDLYGLVGSPTRGGDLSLPMATSWHAFPLLLWVLCGSGQVLLL